MSYPAYYRIVRGQRDASSESLGKLAAALNVTVSELVGQEPPLAVALGARLAPILPELRIGDPVEFMRRLATLSEEDQAAVAQIVRSMANGRA
jgi:transcriptional regulator with XRE-family HTH domain